MGCGDYVTLLLPLKSRSGARKRRLILLGGTEASIENGSEGLRETSREGGELLLPLT